MIVPFLRTSLRAGLAMFCLGAIFVGAQVDPNATLGTVAEVRALRPDEAQRARPVRFNAVVTHFDASRALLFVQDESGGILVKIPSNSGLQLTRGQLVSVEGVTAAGAFAPFVARPVVRLVGESRLPDARPAAIPQLLAGKFDCQRIELTGVASDIEYSGNLTLLHIHNGIEHIDAVFRDAKRNDADLPKLVDARIRVRGVAAILSRSDGGPRRAQVFILSRDDIIVEQPPPPQPYAPPAIPIAEIKPSIQSHRVKVSGRVASLSTNGTIRVRDETGEIDARTELAAPVRRGDAIEVLGFPSRSRGVTILDHAFYRVLAPRFNSQALTNGQASITESNFLPLLQTVAEVSHLAPEEAGRGYPVRLRGVATYYNTEWAMLFVRDSTGAVFVWPSGRPPSIMPGHTVEVNGFSGPGEFVPTVIGADVVVQGSAEMPVAREVSYEKLRSGREDSEWVAIGGIVRSARTDGKHLFLDIAANGGRFDATVSGFTNSVPTNGWIDAEVRIRGVCSVIPNMRRQAIGFRLFAPRPEDLVVLVPAPEDPFDAPEQPAASLFRFGGPGKAGHRIRIAGVVTRQPFGQTMFLRDHTGGLEAELLAPESLKPGDRIDAVGFPGLVDHVPRLENAMVRITGSGPPPAPRPITIEEAAAGDAQADLVVIQARLVETSTGAGQPALVLSAGKSVFEAVLAGTNSLVELSDLPAGSLVELTGIASTTYDGQGQPRGFRLLLESARDCVVLRTPPWWTLRHAVTLAGGLGIVILASMLWVISLRRRVERQTAQIRDALEQEGRLALRYRELFDNATDMVFTTDLRGRISSFNKAAERLTGCPREQALGQSFPRLFGLDEESFLRLATNSDGESVVSSPKELTLETRGGRRVLVEVSFTGLRENNSTIGLQGIARDITDRKRAEEAIHELNQTLEQRVADRTAELQASNRELEAFSYSVSHDLRAPLRAINGFAEILLREFGDRIDAKGQHYLNTVADSGRKMGQLVDDLLTFSRLGRQPLAKASLDMNDLVRQIIDDLRRHEPQREVAFRVSPLPPADGDRTLVGQALMNLIGNAWKFTSQNASATIEVGSYTEGGGTVYFIKDNGAGFDMSFSQKLFGVFQRLHRDEEFPGTGVGLAIVQRVIQRHGGRIWVNAAVNQGATFFFTLPEGSDSSHPAGALTEHHQF